jgi:cytochrome c peroxidase
MIRHIILAFSTILLISACQKNEEEIRMDRAQLTIPNGFPQLPATLANELTDARIALGKQLFYDTRLSADNSISCGSCHRAEYAFAEPLSLSKGIGGRSGFRNAQPLFNLAWKDHYFRDGGVSLLKLTAMNPIQNPNEMGSSLLEIVLKLREDDTYRAAFKKAYNDTISGNSILHALMCFQVGFISGNSRYDQWKNGNPSALSEQEIRGKKLFFSSKTGCSNCHGSFNFDSPGFASNGLFEAYADSGRQRITMDPADRGKFSIPSLRNIAHTAPYMHDGSFANLEEVLNHYSKGGTGFYNTDERIKPLKLSKDEKLDLLAFLESLTDEGFLHNAEFKP